MVTEKVIWKWSIQTGIGAGLPEGAEVIHAGPDPNGRPCVWEIHDEGAPAGPGRHFVLVGAGQPFPGGTHLGTYVAGACVWHLFELDPAPAAT